MTRQLADKQVEAFLPTINRWSRWKDRQKRIAWPLFPGYCFVRIAPAEGRRVSECAGVVQIVSNHGQLSAIPDKEIDAIRTLVTTELAYDPCPLIEVGEMVEVVSGPLRGVMGRLMKKGTHARPRLVLSVNLIGQGVSVEVDAADIRRY